MILPVFSSKDVVLCAHIGMADLWPRVMSGSTTPGVRPVTTTTYTYKTPVPYYPSHFLSPTSSPTSSLPLPTSFFLSLLHSYFSLPLPTCSPAKRSYSKISVSPTSISAFFLWILTPKNYRLQYGLYQQVIVTRYSDCIVSRLPQLFPAPTE